MVAAFASTQERDNMMLGFVVNPTRIFTEDNKYLLLRMEPTKGAPSWVRPLYEWLDTTLPQESYPPGLAWWGQTGFGKTRWTALKWWDQRWDTRRGSHSAIALDRWVDGDTIMQLAKEHCFFHKLLPENITFAGEV